jgi:hypothetical protein
MLIFRYHWKVDFLKVEVEKGNEEGSDHLLKNHL